MTFTLQDWMVYTMWAVFGFMFLDFFIAFFRSFWEGTFRPALVTDYLKDVLYYVVPLNIILSMSSIDPTDWILVTAYFVGGAGVVLKYVLDSIRRFR